MATDSEWIFSDDFGNYLWYAGSVRFSLEKSKISLKIELFPESRQDMQVLGYGIIKTIFLKVHGESCIACLLNFSLSPLFLMLKLFYSNSPFHPHTTMYWKGWEKSFFGCLIGYFLLIIAAEVKTVFLQHPSEF